MSFVPAKAGAYLVEPTSFLSFSTGAYTLKMSSASPARTQGKSAASCLIPAPDRRLCDEILRQLILCGHPLATQAVAGVGAFNKVSLPLGTYFVDAFRIPPVRAGLTPLIRPMASATPGPG